MPGVDYMTSYEDWLFIQVRAWVRACVRACVRSRARFFQAYLFRLLGLITKPDPSKCRKFALEK